MLRNEKAERTIIEVSVFDANHYTNLLMINEPLDNIEEGVDNILRTYSATFKDGCEADIKVCSGTDNYFVDPVLFDESGHELQCLDCEGDLLGGYEFEVNDKKYIVEIVVSGDIYYCEKCGDIVDLSKEYYMKDDEVHCHNCAKN